MRDFLPVTSYAGFCSRQSIGKPVTRLACSLPLYDGLGLHPRHSALAGRRTADWRGTFARMRWAIAIPQYVRDGTFDPGGLRAYLARAEELGFASAWTQENLLGAMPVISPLELMSYAAACTERLRLGCAVFVSPLHTPVHLAKSLASLDQLSRGRIEVGLGVGGGFRDFAAFGLDNAHLVTRFTEGVAMMKALWTEEAVTFPGRFWQTEGVRMEPKPFQKPHPPVWFGGSHPDALRRTVRLADGFFGAGSTSTTDFAAQVGVLRAELERVGRAPAGYPVAKRVYLAVDDDRTGPARASQLSSTGCTATTGCGTWRSGWRSTARPTRSPPGYGP